MYQKFYGLLLVISLLHPSYWSLTNLGYVRKITIPDFLPSLINKLQGLLKHSRGWQAGRDSSLYNVKA
ncbi:uncharacterized protein METZ01_LOCUS219428, partial [marine metagenome]